MTFEEILQEFSNLIVIDAKSESETYLKRLWLQPAGKLLPIQNLMNDLEMIFSGWKNLSQNHKVELFITWLEYPNEPEYCLILFYDVSMWHTVAIYNKAMLMRKVENG